MPAHPRAVLFDLDGTLADTADDMLDALDTLSERYRLAKIDRATATPFISGGVPRLFNQIGIDAAADECFVEKRREYLAYYEETQYQKTTLFPDCAKLLHMLQQRDIAVGVVTNKPRYLAEGVMTRLDLGQLLLVAGDDCVRAKPHADTLLLALRQLALPSAEAVYYVGDDVRDAMAANAAGMSFILAQWGYYHAPDWCDAKVIIDEHAATPAQLWRYLIGADGD